MKLICLASPYSHWNPIIRWCRWFKITKIVGSLIKKHPDCVFISPIVHSHWLAVLCRFPKGFEFWKKQDLLLVKKCDEIWVIMMKGWLVSNGISGELRKALAMDKKIEFVEVD